MKMDEFTLNTGPISFLFRGDEEKSTQSAEIYLESFTANLFEACFEGKKREHVYIMHIEKNNQDHMQVLLARDNILRLIDILTGILYILEAPVITNSIPIINSSLGKEPTNE